MKAEYNKWYKCQEGQMPEDFENVGVGKQVLIIKEHLPQSPISYDVDFRDCCPYEEKPSWYKFSCIEYLAWMLPEPYKKEK